MKTEVRRGRKFVEYIDDSLPVGTFVQEIGAHDVSYQDENSVWRPIDENWETDGQDGFSFRAQRMNHKVRFDSIGAWRWYPRRDVETEYVIINRPRCWLTRTNRWGYLLANGISREGKDITITSLRNVTRVIHSRWNGIKTDWILENADAPTRFQQQIDLVGLTEVDGWLYGADGEQVARLTPTTAIDAEGNELPTSTSYENGILEFSADVTGAVYPVTIDPDFAESASMTVRGQNSNYTTARTTAAYAVTGTVVGQNKAGSTYYDNRTFYKFDTSAIGSGGTVNTVNLRLVCQYNYSDTDFDVQIVKQNWSGQDPLDSNNMDAAFDGCLAGTADANIWRNTSGMSTNTQYTSGNLATDWVVKDGTTYYSLRSDRSVSATTPTQSERIQLWANNAATESYRPCLIVAYTAGSTAYSLECAAGSYSLAGVACTLTYTPAAQNLTLSCGAGSLALTGTACTLSVKRNYVLSCESGGVSYPYIVANCETTAMNGTYIQLYTSWWEKSDGGNTYNLFYDVGEGCLILEASDRSALYYDNNFGGNLPPDDPSIDWYSYYEGTPSALTVTAAPSITYTLTGSPVTLTVQRNYTLIAEAGTLALTGSACTLTYTKATQAPVLTCDAGSYTLTGSAASFVLQRNPTLVLESGSYTLTGSSASFEVKRNFTLACASGSYAVTGTNADLLAQYHYTLACSAGSYTLTGTDISFGNTKSYELVCGAGSYALTGTSVTLEVKHNFTIACNAGSYTLTGAEVTLATIHTYSLACNSGSYLLTGTPVSLTSARSLACNSGAYVLTGLEADLFKGLVLPCGNGSYILTGSPATINSARTFVLGMGSYVLVGTDAGLYILTITPACRTYFIDAENRTLLIGSEDRTHTIDAENRTMEVRCH